MEFLERQKEFTHRSNKLIRCKYITNKFDSCNKCHGMCIFSINFLEQYPRSAALKQKLDERFYAKEFEYLRSLEVESRSEDKENTEPKYSQEEDEEERNTLTIYDLLRKFHSLERSQQNQISKFNHSWTTQRTSKRLGYSTKSTCECSRCSSGREVTTRQKKNRKLVLNNVCDVRLEC